MKTILPIGRPPLSRFSNAFLVTGLAGLVAVLLLTTCRELPVYTARRQVPIGTPRDGAVEILKKDAWYYQTPCDDGNYVTDLFFYGSHRVDDTDIVMVDSRLENGIYRVVLIGSFENYLWPKVYETRCVDMSRFEK